MRGVMAWREAEANLETARVTRRERAMARGTRCEGGEHAAFEAKTREALSGLVWPPLLPPLVS